jgi:zinc transporter
VFRGKRGYIAIVRGINQNENAEREDMVALRIWCDGERVITIRQRQLFVPRQIFTALTKEAIGPASAAELFCFLIDRVIRQMSEIITEYSVSLDEMELVAESDQSSAVSRKLADFRGQVVELRRYVAPQREALAHLLAEPPNWLTDELRPMVREFADCQQRHLEELDALRERSIVIKDDITNRLNEVMNRNMYVISIIAAIFLPLSFVTGLLGINVGGMPGVDSAAAFWITCAIMVFLLIIQIWIFRKFKWF